MSGAVDEDEALALSPLETGGLEGACSSSHCKMRIALSVKGSVRVVSPELDAVDAAILAIATGMLRSANKTSCTYPRW